MTAAQIRFFSLLRREVSRFVKIKRQTVAGPLLETFLYISVFGAALGSRIDTLHGFDYVVFVIPGLIMMAWAMNAFANNSSSILQQKFQRAIDDQLSSPASPTELLLAFTFGGFLRGMTVAVLTFVPLGGPFGMGMSFVSSALLLGAVAALGPLAVRPLIAVVSRLHGPGAVGRLAGQISRAEPRRVAAVAVPLVLMFAINATMLLNSRMLGDVAAAEQAARTAPATAQVTAPQGLTLGTAGTVMAVAGVTGAAATLPTRVVVVVAGGKPEDHPAQGLRTTGTQTALDLGFSAGGTGGDGTFAASRYLAGLYTWTVGQDVDLWLADGHRVRLRLTGIYERSRGFGDAVLPAALVAAHDPRGLVRGIAVRYDTGTGERIRAAVPGVAVHPTTGAAAAGDAQEQQGAWELMVAVSLGFTAIAILNTFAIATAGRRREFADLRLAGATTGQLHRLAAREALVAVAAGLALGALITGVVVGAFSVAQDGELRVIVDPATYATMVLGVAALGLVAGVLPARVQLRRRALPALADDQ